MKNLNNRIKKIEQTAQAGQPFTSPRIIEVIGSDESGQTFPIETSTRNEAGQWETIIHDRTVSNEQHKEQS